MTEIVLQEHVTPDHRKVKLFLGILFDLIGCISYLVPFIGEFSDVVWAPVAGLVLKSMYRGTVGTVGGIIAFVEEVMPGLDFIPTFTLTWIYTYWIDKRNKNV